MPLLLLEPAYYTSPVIRLFLNNVDSIDGFIPLYLFRRV
jgi:hypothetical protein